MDERPESFEHKYKDMIIMYAEVCDWFNELGFTYSKNRYGVYKKHLDRFIKIITEHSELSSEELLKFKREFDNAYLEVNEIIRIYNNIKKIDSNEFIEQIRKIVSGQEFRAQSENDQARDFLFELSVACRFINAGYKVTLNGICDAVIDMEKDGTLFVECKRIKSENKIDKNVKKANKQITNRIINPKLSDAKGLIAINVTDLLPKTNIFYPDNKLAATSIHRGVSNNFVRNHLTKLIAGKDKNCLGIMCESSIMLYFSKYSEINGFEYSRHTEYIPYYESSLFETLVPKLSRQNIT